MSELCIGLFGTCGNSQWREPFIKAYESLGIPFFNPQLPPGAWKPECAAEEAHHLANDTVILFPVTGETYGFGSLAETGFSMLQAIRLDDRRDFVVLIEPRLNDDLMKDETLARESLRSRALVAEHLKKLRLPNVYWVDTFEEMMDVSLILFQAARKRTQIEKFNPHRKQ